MFKIVCSKEPSWEKFMKFCEWTWDKYFLRVHVSNTRRRRWRSVGGGGVAGRNVLIRHTVIGAEQVNCLSLKGLIRELLVEADRLSRSVNTRNTFPTLVNNIWQVMSASDEDKLLSWRCKIIEQNNRRVSVLSEKFLSAWNKTQSSDS